MSGEWHGFSPVIDMVKEGHVGETLALHAGPMGKIVAKHDILL
jgi:hypothetical protein